MDGQKERQDKMKVRDLMTADPIVSKADVTVEHILALMQKASIRHIPIVDEKGLFGVISDRDLMFLHGLPGVIDSIDEQDVRQVLEAPVSLVMKSRFLVDRDVVTVGEDAPVREAVNILVASKVGALPVVDDDDQVVGVLSPIDILRWVADEGL